MKQIIIIGVSTDYTNYFFKESKDDDFSFTPWIFDINEGETDCIYATCLNYITNDIFHNQNESTIEDIHFICSKYTDDSVIDIFIYESDDFMSKVNCDFLRYDEKTLDYDFNLINSWIISYIYNKHNRVYIF